MKIRLTSQTYFKICKKLNVKKIIKKIIELNIFPLNQSKEMEVTKNKMDKSKEISKKKQQEQKNLDHLKWAEKIQVK